jgi:endonuclease/exonuclease/phosphatase family metal-dependent hydrolase
MGLTLATFNVKDLLEPRVEAKLDWIARVLTSCDADVVGLQEVGPPELLAAVLDRVPARGGYGEPVVGTADARGIRCALLSRLRVLEARVHTAEALPFPVFRAGDPPPFGVRIPLRRGVVHARVDAPGMGPLDVLVVHFKSSRPVPARDATGRELPASSAHARAEASLRSLAWRAAEALHVRGLVDAVLTAQGADARVAVAGDLNDVPDSPVLRVVRSDGAGELLDCAVRVAPEARFSTLHDGRRTQIDHVLASASLYARLQAARFLNADLREHEPVADARPGGPPPPPPTIDSDHAPLVTSFG